jgi:hypothetical protein
LVALGPGGMAERRCCAGSGSPHCAALDAADAAWTMTAEGANVDQITVKVASTCDGRA